MSVRKIIQIDEEKCDGCGLCVPACAEGAIQIIDGKAKLVSEQYCDGLGACIGDCPQDAITMIEREAAEFSEKAVKKHLARTGSAKAENEYKPTPDVQKITPAPCCPGSFSQMLQPAGKAQPRFDAEDSGGYPSQLTNWPVQLHLAPVKAPYFEGASLLIAADCVPFALPDFHRRFLAGRTLLIGCPKLDDVEMYLEKLTQIFIQNDIRAVEVGIMEVPCCTGLLQLVRMALENAGKDLPLTFTRVSLRGKPEEAVKIPCKRQAV